MPDQSSAATEHSILQEITAPLETLPDDPVAVVVHADFPSALRGYDRIAVDAYVAKVSQLVAELQATRSPEAAIRRALERVGEQISGVLQRAHETAEQITAQSRAEAEDRLEECRREAAEITAGAEQRVSALDADADRIWTERDRIIEDARELGRQLGALAQTAAEQSPAALTAPYDDATSAPRHDDPPPADDDEPTADYDDQAEVEYDDQAEVGDDDQVEVESAATGSAAAGSDGEREDSDDPEATVAFRAVQPTIPAPAPAQTSRRSSSVIPPASQAATRRPSS